MTTTASDPLPDDTDALKAALIETRAKLSGAEALIEHLQLLVRDQRAVLRSLRAGNRELRRNLQRLRPLGRQRLFQGDNLIQNHLAISVHATQ